MLPMPSPSLLPAALAEVSFITPGWDLLEHRCTRRQLFVHVIVDPCRDSKMEDRNLQKTGVTDGSLLRCKERSETVIEPISNPRRLPVKPLPNTESLDAEG